MWRTADEFSSRCLGNRDRCRAVAVTCLVDRDDLNKYMPRGNLSVEGSASSQEGTLQR